MSRSVLMGRQMVPPLELMETIMTQLVTELDVERSYRSLMGRYATGVAVIAATHGTERIGMAVNSFTSVSLSPALLLSGRVLGRPRCGVFWAARRNADTPMDSEASVGFRCASAPQ